MTLGLGWSTGGLTAGPPPRFDPCLRTAGEIMAQRRAAAQAVAVRDFRTEVLVVTVRTVSAISAGGA
jgi:hypothetical protein